jgi:hypothetical protein
VGKIVGKIAARFARGSDFADPTGGRKLVLPSREW